MDLKITKKRFEEHWAYDWIKYIAVVLVCIFVEQYPTQFDKHDTAVYGYAA